MTTSGSGQLKFTPNSEIYRYLSNITAFDGCASGTASEFARSLTSRIINMDQTPMYLSMHPKQTLELQGSRTVHGRITTEGGSRFTCTVAVLANGNKLKPMCIFKGTVHGRIVQREFPQNPARDDIILCCQTAAWQDKDNMLLWIDRVLVPYLQDRALGAPAAILLDQFKVHWTNEVLARLNQLGITPYKIPAGCTGLVQPVDVGIGKPFKDHVRSQWSA